MILTASTSTSQRGLTNRKWKAVVLCTTWGLLLAQGFVLPAMGQDPPQDGPSVPSNKARVVISSDPASPSITLDGRRLQDTTPAELSLNPGQYFMTVNAEGYQPLSHEITVSAGEQLELEFVLLKTPPEPPTAEELRALAPPFGADDPDSDYWADAKPRHLENDSCLDCHPSILKLHAQGEHRTLACEDCHSVLSDHVKDDKVIGTMQVIRGVGIQGLCMTCHDRDNPSKIRQPARTIILRRHLQELRVRPVNVCEDCHHVHDPMKWTHEAREMVGLPEMMATIPLLEEKLAYDKKKRYDAMAETFFVFPLAPGILGMAVSEGDDQFPAEAFLVAGFALVIGSYLLGNRSYKKERERIRVVNDERRAVNMRVKNHNKLVKEAMADHEKAVNQWAMDSDGRGRVVVREQ